MGKANKTSFKPGKPGGPGRPKGSRNKLGEQFIQDLYADWQEHGVEVLVRVRQEDPGQYLKVVASILPKELHFKEPSLFDEAFVGVPDEIAIQALQEIVRQLDEEKKRRIEAGEWKDCSLSQ